MDQGTLVEDLIADGRRFIERFAADGNPVQAAFWAKTADDELWFLYIATELVDRFGPATAYRAVHSSLQKLGETSVSSSEIKVISPSSAIAADVLAVMTRYPGRLARRLGARRLGPIEADQAYVYPARVFATSQANPMTTEEIGREIVRLMNRGPGILQSSRIVLKDGTAFAGVPFSIQLGSHNALVVQFVTDGEAAPRVYRLDEIASIT